MSTREQIAARIVQRAHELLRQAAPLCAAHRARVPDPVILLDLRGQTAGQAVWRRARRPLLRFNLDIAQRHQADFVERTVTHEVAHLVTAACHGRVPPHGPHWREVMRHLGVAEPTRCHSYTVDEAQVRRQRRWPYACDCSLHELSTTRHNRVQNAQARYHCRRCGGSLRAVTSSGD